ncbi:hypothetical protein A2392_01405 [Candidatus Kaiserbacteria bacterium RIFOXYB1_FULL_46_14]|uniref:Uncharacterized protein n=1 Tax=Candidatus Kaiserbacteria bacterium RIFOXYB1_FULL_46_14 TaxID=1798531 RepID=A0A1F6FJQ9_9BACT|nr:MAG: hypothetical protein A2392_01405 [Candidatus Kaiserbacteria bacterium RIFOXYB1_FULL_46_14]
MPLPVWTLLISGFLLLSFFLLFATEASAGHRIVFARARAFADLRVADWQSKAKRHIDRWGGFNFRTLLHYLFHQLLSALLFINRLVERYISKLRHHNKQIARRAKQVSGSGHLAEIAIHKEDTALTDAEKTARKDHALQ